MNNKIHSMNEILVLLAIGLVAGILSGMIGIGGGVIIVPALIFFVGFSQQNAQGTTLMMFLPPIGILAVYNYYKAGYADWKVAGIMAITFIIGSFFGSKVAISVDQATLKKVFAVVLLILSLKMFFGK
jgi:uncharacterized membrane protein YfcA